LTIISPGLQFKVDNFHTYHVGENRVLVHNANKYVKGTSKTGQGSNLSNQTREQLLKSKSSYEKLIQEHKQNCRITLITLMHMII